VSPVENLIAWALTTLGSAFVGSYLAAYSKKKGEIRATHEELGKLAKQMDVVTTTQKQIEARISNEVWDRQRRWELKRDALLEATKKMAVLHKALVEYAAAAVAPNRTEEQRRDALTEAGDRWTDTLAEFGTAISIVGLICGTAMEQFLTDVSVEAASIVIKVGQEQMNMAKLDAMMRAFQAKAAIAAAAMKKELDI
jgi:gas vesicle protein